MPKHCLMGVFRIQKIVQHEIICSHASNSGSMNNFVAGNRSIKLSVINLPKFGGEISQWLAFKGMFGSLVNIIQLSVMF